MAAPAAVQSNYLPAILIEQARLDGIPIERLLEQIRTTVDDIPEPEPPAPEICGTVPQIEPAEPEAPRLPLRDRNGLYVRDVTLREAVQLVNSGQAVADLGRGWTSNERSDLPWLAVRLVLSREVICWDPSGITCDEMKLIAGLEGDTGPARRARAKLECWREAH